MGLGVRSGEVEYVGGMRDMRCGFGLCAVLRKGMGRVYERGLFRKMSDRVISRRSAVRRFGEVHGRCCLIEGILRFESESILVVLFDQTGCRRLSGG